MTGTQKIQLDEFVDPFEVNLQVHRDSSGMVTEVTFDLTGLPRVDSMLVGKTATELPDITKRLCGICPVVHHLAGVAAVESLYGISEIPTTARAIRQLLACGSALDTLAAKYITGHREFAVSLKRTGKQLMTMAGSPTHFPDVAIPGGVRAPAQLDNVPEALASLHRLEASVVSLIDAATQEIRAGAQPWRDSFVGADVAAVKRDGKLDQLGGYLAVSVGDESRVVAAHEWADCFRESYPGAAAPRPLVTVADRQLPYRVGPLSRGVIAGNKAATTALAQLESTLAYVRQAQELLEGESLRGSELVYPHEAEKLSAADWAGTRTGVGLIDGPRGLLVHSYTAGADGVVTKCQIMTPTAQNEPWLAQMLSEQYVQESTVEGELESSIRMADPCLPCSSAPEGLMNVRVHQD